MFRTFTFPSPIVRRMPDPNFKAPSSDGSPGSMERYVLMVPVAEMPVGVPMDPNPRTPNISRRVYQEVERSLLNQVDGEDGTFHLKHKGITLVADSVAVSKRGGKCVIRFGDGHGILDGGHTYALIEKHQSPDEEPLPEAQFVKVEVLTQVPDDLLTSITGGLNTAMQVQPKSLDNLNRLFDWIKDELRNETYFDKIAWREGDGEAIDVRDLIAIMTCFNIGSFPDSASQHPVSAHEKKSDALKRFEEDERHYEQFRPILREILTLHDKIRYESSEKWNRKEGQPGRFASLSFVRSQARKPNGANRRKPKLYDFPFLDAQADHQMMESALYPMLASFRWMVEEDEEGYYQWRGGFETVCQRWDQAAVDLLQITANASREFSYSPNKVGKSRNHWTQLYTQLKICDMQVRAGL